MNLDETVAAIRGLDRNAAQAAREHQDRLTKPRGSLGMLEEISIQLAGLAGRSPAPVPSPAAVAVFVGDHGVHAQGVTAWPQEVTGQMVANFLAGGAVINALARQTSSSVVVVDVGMGDAASAVVADADGLLRRKVRAGTADLSVGPAMTRDEAEQAIAVGLDVAEQLIAQGARCLIAGDMGLGNTTPSAALIAKLTTRTAADVTGRGTGISDEMYAHKVDVITSALDRQASDAADPIGVLADLGGLEHAAIVGFILAAAAARIPVILDGVIANSAALVAHALAVDVSVALIAGHRSLEPAAGIALDALGLTPVLTLDLRLGEGSGAMLALPIVQSAAVVLAEVATFDSAGVTDKHDNTPVATRPADESLEPKAGSVAIVGGGPGDPGLITQRGWQLLSEADVVVADRLAPLALLEGLPRSPLIIDAAKIPGGRSMPQEQINQHLVEHARAGRAVVRLKGGDPFVFGRGMEEVEACAAAGVAVQVVPGVTSAISVPAMVGVPVTHRGINQAFTVVSGHVPPGHPDSQVDWAALARSGATLVVMMGVRTLPAIATALLAGGLPTNTPTITVVDGGSPQMTSVRSTLGEVGAVAGLMTPAVTVIGAVAALSPVL